MHTYSLATLALVVASCAGPATRSASSGTPTGARVPVARRPTPCFPGTRSLAALEIHHQLQRYVDSLYSPETPLPPGTFGSCTLDRNILREADGRVVAELGCGVRVTSPGIHDQHGIEIGARGRDVLDRMPASGRALTCVANGPDQVRCRFDRLPDSDVDANSYVVAGTLDDDVLAGEAAAAFFAPRIVVELQANVWCH